MKNATITSIVNIKGGVGKTTTTCAFAELLAKQGRKVLVVDLDPQFNTSRMFRVCPSSTQPSVATLFILPAKVVQSEHTKDITDCIYRTDNPNIDIIPSNEDLSVTEELIRTDTSRIQQKILSKCLARIQDRYDNILIDNSPFFNMLTINSLTASDNVITPVESDGYSYHGLTLLLDRINSIKEELNEALEFLGIFLTKAEPNTVSFRAMFETYQKELGDKFLDTYIRKDISVKESTITLQPLLTYKPDCRAAEDYTRLLEKLDI